ncbi:MAG: site-specific integrase [Parabacteroides sp.]|nr:site-specific integrase [Parabacteroides sp.]
MGITERPNKENRAYVCLTEKELSRLMKATFDTLRLEQVRDLFIFSCYTGLHYQILEDMGKRHIQTKYGLQWIVMSRSKTKAFIHIPLLSVLQMIIKKYESRFVGMENILPVPSNQRLNLYFKEIAGLCGIEKDLSMYIAIHTFKRTLAAASGIPAGTVCKMLGRFDLRDRNAYVTDRIIKREMHKISENFPSLEKIAMQYMVANR